MVLANVCLNTATDDTQDDITVDLANVRLNAVTEEVQVTGTVVDLARALWAADVAPRQDATVVFDRSLPCRLLAVEDTQVDAVAVILANA